jgi:hypothetical protein
MRPLVTATLWIVLTTAAQSDERTACREAYVNNICLGSSLPTCREVFLKECIPDCDTGCWVGYAWNRHTKSFEWFFIAYDSYSECVGAAKGGVANSDSYREPFGCAYTWTSLWRTVLMNKLWGPRELFCIAKNSNELAYSPSFESPSDEYKEKYGSHCVYSWH